jgi:hypothetical protein
LRRRYLRDVGAPPRRFDIRYAPWLRGFFTVLGLGPRRSWVELDEDKLAVRMGWAFRAEVPRASIVGAEPGRAGWFGIGVHSNLRFDTWLVNGSASGIVWLTVAPPARGRMAGIPVPIRRLGLGLEDSEGFLAALSRRRTW